LPKSPAPATPDPPTPRTRGRCVGEFLTRFEKYPPRQTAASFNLDEFMKKLQQGGGSK
jgi:hypothetical protein